MYTLVHEISQNEQGLSKFSCISCKCTAAKTVIGPQMPCSVSLSFKLTEISQQSYHVRDTFRFNIGIHTESP